MFDKTLGLTPTTTDAALSKKPDGYYAGTPLDEADKRLALMDASAADIEASKDPFLNLAVALYDHDRAQEEAEHDRAGRGLALRPALYGCDHRLAARERQDHLSDANSTLRVTYGTVLGGSPKDGLIYTPFTTLEGITAKDTGEEPFNAPVRELELIRAKDYGPYELQSIGSVPVNFLSDLDSTGGSRGSATMNARGELVGLLFDGTFESVNSEWDFDPRTTRTIHVDTSYMLWTMDKVEGADALIDEMDVVK